MATQQETSSVEASTSEQSIGGGSSDIEMFVEPSDNCPRPTKRKLVDTEGKEVPDEKRSRATPNCTLKHKAIFLIMHWHEYLLWKAGNVITYDLDIVADVTSIVQTIHTKMRQDANGSGSIRDKITDAFTFTIGETIIRYDAIKVGMRKIAELYGFTYNITTESKEKLGTLSSLLVLFCAFRSRLNEVRIGNDKITFKKSADEVQQMPLSQFGMDNTHCILLTGCTYTPTLQSSMKNSLGPMTIAVNLCMTTDQRYQKSWVDAFVQTFKLIPNVAEIAELLKGSRQRYYTVLSQLANLALAGITRNSNKAFIPVALLLTKARTCNAYRNLFQTTCSETHAITVGDLPPEILNLDFSGKGLYNLWNTSRELGFSMRRGNRMTDQTAREIFLHATFGTHKENLALLDWMTSHTFQTRREIGDQFKQKSCAGGNYATFRLIPFVYMAKLAGAAQTDFLVGGRGQICRNPTFSGSFTQRVDLGSDFVKVFKNSGSEAHLTTLNGELGIISTLKSISNKIHDRLRKEGKIEYGTTSFYKWTVNSNHETYGESVACPEILLPKYFYQQDVLSPLN